MYAWLYKKEGTINSMSEVVEGVIVDLIPIVKFWKEVLEVVLVYIFLVEVFKLSKDAEHERF